MSSVTLNPTQASYVYYNNAAKNYNDNDWLRVGVQADSSVRRYYTAIQFNLSSIPSNSIISGATLRMYSYSNECWKTSVTQLAKRITSSWSSSLTYDTRPSVTTTNQTSHTTSGSYDTWEEWNVKNIVQEWSNGTANYGFWMEQDGLTLEKGKCYKKSGTYAPQLVIDYTPVGMKAKYDGTWEDCLVRAKYNGSWKLCKAHAKYNGSWKLCK